MGKATIRLLKLLCNYIEISTLRPNCKFLKYISRLTESTLRGNIYNFLKCIKIKKHKLRYSFWDFIVCFITVSHCDFVIRIFLSHICSSNTSTPPTGKRSFDIINIINFNFYHLWKVIEAGRNNGPDPTMFYKTMLFSFILREWNVAHLSLNKFNKTNSKDQRIHRSH